MTTEQGPASAREVYFQLAASDLPAPRQVAVSTEDPIVSMTFAAEADLEAWAEALNASRDFRRDLSDDGKRYTWYYTFNAFLGRHGYLTYHEPVPPRIPDERVEEILDGLNGFIVHEYETVSDIVYGRAVHSRESVGCDFNLGKALDWAMALREVSTTAGPDNGNADVELHDGTVIEWVPAEKSWAVTVSDDAEAEVAK